MEEYVKVLFVTTKDFDNVKETISQLNKIGRFNRKISVKINSFVNNGITGKKIIITSYLRNLHEEYMSCLCNEHTELIDLYQ